jgi:hypothetical protein
MKKGLSSSIPKHLPMINMGNGVPNSHTQVIKVTHTLILDCVCDSGHYSFEFQYDPMRQLPDISALDLAKKVETYCEQHNERACIQKALESVASDLLVALKELGHGFELECEAAFAKEYDGDKTVYKASARTVMEPTY